jgi:hypothetical protein
MWRAQFVSNVGSWMQTVGAHWLILALTGSAAYGPAHPDRATGQSILR